MTVPVENGSAASERLEYPLGAEMRWVWLNPSGNVHPVQMHGSYFRVVASGDAERNEAVSPSKMHDVSTNFMAVGAIATWSEFPPHKSRRGRWRKSVVEAFAVAQALHRTLH